MNRCRFLLPLFLPASLVILLASCGGTPSTNKLVSSGNSTQGTAPYQLQVSKTGDGAVVSNPAGINCGGTCSASFASGTQVVLTATPGQGMIFSGWSGPCTGTGTCSLQMSANTSVTATFAAPSSPIAVTISPTTATLEEGQTQQFKAAVSGTSNAAVAWSVDGVAGGNATVGTINTSGLYTAPGAAGTHTVLATSVADSTKSASAAVTVTLPTQAATFSGQFTYHNDNNITGLNPKESVLTPANVNATQFGKLFTRALDGYVFAQPLYVPNVNISGKGTFNVVYVATEHDSVYAYDADGGVSSALWHRSFIDSSSGITTVPASDIFNNYDEGPEVGITSTPVIDPSSGTMYVVAVTKENGSYFQRLHALDISTGAEKFGGPVAISASVSGTGLGAVNGVVTFDPLLENQRAALLLANGNVYVAFSSHGDGGNNHGWLFAFSASSLSRVAFWCTSPNDWDAAIWGAGSGLAADGSGNVFAVTSNGTFNYNSGGKDVADSYVKLSASLGILDYFTPYDQQTLNNDDLDAGASGVLLVPDAQSNTIHIHLAIGSNKRGDLYVIDRDNMGKYQTSSNTNIVQYLPRALGQNSQDDQYFGVGAYWNGNLYFAGSYDNLKQFSLQDGLLSASPTHQSPEVVATDRGARPVVSSNGNSAAIVWLISTDSGASTPTLRAYDAGNVNHELYNSTQNPSRDTPTGGVLKFNSPTIANGKVYFAAQKNLNVYGLLP